jgi:hypothetical protein
LTSRAAGGNNAVAMSRKRAKRAAAPATQPAAKAAVKPAGRLAGAPAPVLGFGRNEGLALLLLLAAACLVTANGLGGEFVLDDTSKIVANTDIRRLADLPSTLIYPYQANQLLERNDPSRPLVFLIYGVVYHFFGLNPVAYHAVNAVFHFGSAVLVFLLARLMLWRLLGGGGPSGRCWSRSSSSSRRSRWARSSTRTR